MRLSATGKRIACAHYAEDSSHRIHVARHCRGRRAVFASPDLPGALAVATCDLLGDVGPGGAWTSLLAPTGIFGPAPSDAGALSAWPSKDGTTFYVADARTRVTWVRRGTGRWWRLQASGRDLFLISALDGTHALVAPAGADLPGGPVRRPVRWESSISRSRRSTRPASSPSPEGSRAPSRGAGPTPTRRPTPGCATAPCCAARPRLQYRPDAARPRPRPHLPGHGDHLPGASVALDVEPALSRSPGRASTPPRPRLTGTPLAGSRLTCSARTSITWLRGGRTVPGLHARSYRVQPADRGLLHRLPHAAGGRHCASRRAPARISRASAPA